MANMRLSISPLEVRYAAKEALNLSLVYKRILISTGHPIQKYECPLSFPLFEGSATIEDTAHFTLDSRLETTNTIVQVQIIGKRNKKLHFLGEVRLDIAGLIGAPDTKMTIPLTKSDDPNASLALRIKSEEVRPSFKKPAEEKEHCCTLQTQSYHKETLLLARRSKPHIPTAYEISRKNFASGPSQPVSKQSIRRIKENNIIIREGSRSQEHVKIEEEERENRHKMKRKTQNQEYHIKQHYGVYMPKKSLNTRNSSGSNKKYSHVQSRYMNQTANTLRSPSPRVYAPKPIEINPPRSYQAKSFQHQDDFDQHFNSQIKKEHDLIKIKKSVGKEQKQIFKTTFPQERQQLYHKHEISHNDLQHRNPPTFRSPILQNKKQANFSAIKKNKYNDITNKLQLIQQKIRKDSGQIVFSNNNASKDTFEEHSLSDQSHQIQYNKYTNGKIQGENKKKSIQIIDPKFADIKIEKKFTFGENVKHSQSIEPDVNQYQSKIHNLQQKISQKQKQIMSKATSIFQFEETIKKQKNLIIQLSNKNIQLTEEIEKHKKQLQQKETSANQKFIILSKQIQKNNQINKLTNSKENQIKLRQLQKNRQQLQQQIKAKDKLIDKMTELYQTKLQKNIPKRQKDIEIIEQKNVLLERKLINLETQNNKLLKEMQGLTARHEILFKEKKAENANFLHVDKQKEWYEQERKTRQRQKQDFLKEKKTLVFQQEKLRNKQTLLMEVQANLQEEKQSLDEKKAMMQKERKQLQNQKQEFKNKKVEFESKQQKGQKQTQVMNKKDLARKGSIAKLSLETNVLAALKQQNEALRKETNALKQMMELKKGVSQNEIDKKYRRALEEKYAASDNLVNVLKQELSQKKQQLANVNNLIWGKGDQDLMDQFQQIIGLSLDL